MKRYSTEELHAQIHNLKCCAEPGNCDKCGYFKDIRCSKKIKMALIDLLERVEQETDDLVVFAYNSGKSDYRREKRCAEWLQTTKESETLGTLNAVMCSECRSVFYGRGKDKYCRECGARMTNGGNLE